MRGLLIMLLVMAAVKSAKAVDFAVKEAIEKRSGERRLKVQNSLTYVLCQPVGTIVNKSQNYSEL
jgi:hypothetical protein